MSINTFFILASASKSRTLILKKINLNFKNIRPKCDESYYKKKFRYLKYSSEKISLELAKIKAKSVSVRKKESLIIGSDTVINYKGKIIEKAKSIITARKNIKKLSGKKHIIISSAAAYYKHKLIWSCSEKTIVKLRKLNTQDINKYLKMCGNTILGSVGCYQIEKNGPLIIENIKGDFFNVMGFPLFPFLCFLKKFKIKK